MSIYVLKLFDDYCLIWAPPSLVQSIRRSSIDGVRVYRDMGYWVVFNLHGEAVTTGVSSLEEGLRIVEWHLGQPIPPPEILAIEDPVAYEEATKAWVKSSCEKTPEP